MKKKGTKEILCETAFRLCVLRDRSQTCPFLFFLSLPPWGKVPPKGADEGAGFGFPFVGRAVLQGFALRGEFLFHVEKEPKDAGGRRRGELRSPMTAYPQTPITGDAYLLDFAEFPARKI